MKPRLSQNQKDTLFILALLDTKQVNGPIPTAKIKAMIDQSRAVAIDPSNFRKGLHTLASRGLVELPRGHDLSLAISLTRLGRHDAARIYCERTGAELDVPVQDDEQVTIFDAIESHDQRSEQLVSIQQRITDQFSDECSEFQIDEMVEKFDVVVGEVEDLLKCTNQSIDKLELEVRMFNELLKEGERAFLNIRYIRAAAREVVNNL